MSGVLLGKIAVITGSSTGIGLGIARRFVAEGVRVVIVGRRRQIWMRRFPSIGIRATSIAADVSKLDELDTLFHIVKDRHGRIDALVANAGGGAAALGAITEEDFDKTLAINVKDVVFTVQKALPLMAAGSIGLRRVGLNSRNCACWELLLGWARHSASTSATAASS